MKDKFNIVSLAPLSLPIRVMVNHTIGRVVEQVHTARERGKEGGRGRNDSSVCDYRNTPSDTDATFSKTGSYKISSPNRLHLDSPNNFGVDGERNHQRESATDVTRIPPVGEDIQGLTSSRLLASIHAKRVETGVLLTI